MSYSTIGVIGGALLLACVISWYLDNRKARRPAALNPAPSRYERARAWYADHRDDPFAEWSREDQSRAIAPMEPEPALMASAVIPPPASDETVVIRTAPPTDEEVYAAALRRNAAYENLDPDYITGQIPAYAGVPLPEPEPVMLESAPVEYDFEKDADDFIADMKAKSRAFLVNLIGEDRLREIEAERELVSAGF